MSEVMMIGFYHRGDLDGVCSGAILKKAFGDRILLYGVEYGDKIDLDKVVEKDSTVYVIDYAFEPFSKMLELNRKAKLIWIDHHVSAINEMKHAGVEFLGLLGDDKNSKSAAQLAWENFFPNKSLPKGIELISLYDTWQHEFKSEILDFYKGLETETALSINSKAWEYIFENRIEFIQEMSKIGAVISKYVTTNNKQYALEHGFETMFEGYKAIVINKAFGGSMLFDAIWDEEKYDIMISFSRRKNGIWKFSLYTTKKNVDCSVIAKKWGGGGHKSAAGFEREETNLPFEI